MPKVNVNITHAEIKRLFTSGVKLGVYKDDDLIYIARRIMDVVVKNNLENSEPLFVYAKQKYEKYWSDYLEKQRKENGFTINRAINQTKYRS